MELWALQNITEGTLSLSEIERTDPLIGQKLKKFVDTINRCCRDAYNRFSSCLDSILNLPAQPTDAEKAAALETLHQASNSQWFHDVANICDDLASLANNYDKDIKEVIQKHPSDGRRHSLQMLLLILHKHEGDLKGDIRGAVDRLKGDLADSKILEARERALSIKNEIEDNLTRINVAASRITGSSTDGAEDLLTRQQVAEAALRRPERVLLFNMAMVLLLFVIGAGAFQFLSLVQFPLLSGFIITILVVLNAFYLRSIDKLSEEPFIELLKLALLKFFAPLARRSGPM